MKATSFMKAVNIMRFIDSINAGFMPTVQLVEFLVKKHRFKKPEDKEFRDTALGMLTFEGAKVVHAEIEDHLIFFEMEVK